MLPIFNGIISNIFKEIGYTSSLDNYNNSLNAISRINKADIIDLPEHGINLETPEMMEFVRNFHLTTAVLNLYSDMVTDLYRDSSITVTIDDKDPSVTDYINEIILKVDIKSNILRNIEDFLFYGSFGKYLNHDEKRLVSIYNPNNFMVYYEQDIPKLSIINDGTSKPLKYYDGFWLLYKPQTIKVFPQYDEDGEELPYYEREVKVGNSLLRGVILRLYSMYIKEYLADQMDLKESLKNEILVTNISDPNTTLEEIREAVDNVYNLVNDRESMSILSRSPSAILALIDEKMVNNINVVPGLQNVTNFDKMEVASLRDKIQLLRESITEDEQKILKTLGIPDELMNNSSTKWESIERSSRFATSISNIISRINDGISLFCQSQIYYKYKRFIPIDKISINTDVTSILKGSENSFKYKTLQENFSALNDVINSYTEIINQEVVNKETAYEYAIKKISSIDSTMNDLIIKPTEDNSNDES